jgi:YHS domain-containing protein
MIRSLFRTGSLAAVILLMAMSVFAAPPAKGKAAVKAPSCPVCHMKLSAKKTAANPIAVKINGKTYYCCSKCAKEMAAMHKKAPAKGAVKK